MLPSLKLVLVEVLDGISIILRVLAVNADAANLLLIIQYLFLRHLEWLAASVQPFELLPRRRGPRPSRKEGPPSKDGGGPIQERHLLHRRHRHRHWHRPRCPLLGGAAGTERRRGGTSRSPSSRPSRSASRVRDPGLTAQAREAKQGRSTKLHCRSIDRSKTEGCCMPSRIR